MHYRCDEQADWQPDLEDMKRKITSRTRGIVVINPNNPTGAVYSRAIARRDIVEIARQNDLILFADEIYDKIIYDDAVHTPLASLAPDLLVLSFNGLSKTYRVAGFRTGWMVISGAKHRATDYIEGLNILASMRLCANVPTQHAIQTALGGYQSIVEFIRPGGRLYQQRAARTLATESDRRRQLHDAERRAVSVSRSSTCGASTSATTRRFAFDLLRQEKILVVQGTGFNWPEPDHFRIVFLPREEELIEAIGRLGEFLATYRQ